MAHSLYSPSSAKGFMSCWGRIALEEQIPRGEPGKYADIGTATHTVAADVLLGLWPASARIGEYTPVSALGEPWRQVEFTDEMAEWAQTYADDVRAQVGPGDVLYVEKWVDYSHIAGIPDQGGTLDAGVIKPALKELQVHDLKTGMHPVAVDKNPQLMIYALGLLNEVDLTYDIEHVRLFIHQPKVNSGPIEWACSVEELVAFGKKVGSAIQDSEAARRELKETGMTERWCAMYLNQKPNDEDCAFCRAKPTCPSMQRHIQEVIGMTFSDMTKVEVGDADEAISGLPPADLAECMAAADLIEDWLRAVRAETERRLLAGDTVDGWGLELGRQGARKWADAKAADELIREKFRLPMKLTYDISLKSPTQMEKLTKPVGDEKPVIGERQWKSLQALIGRSDPKPSVKRLKDITKPYTPQQLSGDAFKPVDEDLA